MHWQSKALPCASCRCRATDVFDRQDAAYKASVLTRGMPRVAIEAGVTDFWYKYVGLEGAVIGIDTFGESAPAPRAVQALRLHGRERGGQGQDGACLSNVRAGADARPRIRFLN